MARFTLSVELNDNSKLQELGVDLLEFLIPYIVNMPLGFKFDSNLEEEAGSLPSQKRSHEDDDDEPDYYTTQELREMSLTRLYRVGDLEGYFSNDVFEFLDNRGIDSIGLLCALEVDSPQLEGMTKEVYDEIEAFRVEIDRPFLKAFKDSSIEFSKKKYSGCHLTADEIKKLPKQERLQFTIDKVAGLDKRIAQAIRNRSNDLTLGSIAASDAGTLLSIKGMGERFLERLRYFFEQVDIKVNPSWYE